jgi:glucose-6-phosphate 1-dehydrogenase
METIIIKPTQKPTTKKEVLERLVIAKEMTQSFSKAQCYAYPGQPDAETYFQLELEALSDNDWLSDIEKIVIASGKYLAAKATEIRLTNRDGDTLTFGFHNNQIIVSCNGEKQVFDCTPTGNTQAYENVLEALYLGDHSLFIDADVAIEALRIITPALESKAQVPMHKYEAGSDFLG